jgi:hypothetical protein
VGGLFGGLVLIIAGWSWMLRPRELRGMRRRLVLFGRLFGVRRLSSETPAGYAQRLSGALPSDTTTLLHRDGNAAPRTRRVRERASSLLHALADFEGRAAYSGHALPPEDVVRWRRAWIRLCRAAPLLVWRHVVGRAPH